MSQLPADVLIVGAGPTGCALGSYLSKRGARVTLVESVERPEQVVGESMLPCSGLIFEELDFDLSGFLVKNGAVFCQDGRSVRFDFSEAESPRYTHAYQVQREVFDLRFRETALRHGCRIVYGEARDVTLPPAGGTGHGTLHTRDGDLHADLIVDAAGRSMWMSRKLGLRVGDERLRNAGVGTRCRGVAQLEPDQVGDITICCVPDGWIWIIPFGGGLASVGCVTTRDSDVTGGAEERWKTVIGRSADATARLRDAERLLPFRGVQDFTATSTRFYGPGFALCGDAATFIDPIFSSGVLLGLHGARQLASALDGGGEAAMVEWEREYRDGASLFRRVIDCWYAGEFMTLALVDPAYQKAEYRRGIVSLLAGDVYDPERMAPRWMAEVMPRLARIVRKMQEPAGSAAPTRP